MSTRSDIDTDQRLHELRIRARELWPLSEANQREWIKAVNVRDAMLGITTRYLGTEPIYHDEEPPHAQTLR